MHKTTVNFTCDNKPWVVGEGVDLYNTLFHEWGHAAHFANMDMQDVILNTEYPPASTAWAETQSMFMDTMLSSIERRTRYAKFPFHLFEERVRKLWPIASKWLMSICAIIEFERRIYTTEVLTKELVIQFATEISDKHFDFSEPFLFVMWPVHLYSWENACSYHGYGLAELGLAQAREYFYDKYGYIVDNLNVGEEMTRYWRVWSSIGFAECIQWLTGKPIAAESYLKSINRTVDQVLQDSRDRIAKLETIPFNEGSIDIGAVIKIVDGKEQICDSSVSFEDMCEKFKIWIQTKKKFKINDSIPAGTKYNLILL